MRVSARRLRLAAMPTDRFRRCVTRRAGGCGIWVSWGAALPAVDGLCPSNFAAPCGGQIVFSASLAASGEGRGWRVLARLLRSMRDRIVASDGVEAADRALPDWQIEEVASLGQASPPGAALALEETGTAETDETDETTGDEDMTGESDRGGRAGGAGKGACRA